MPLPPPLHNRLTVRSASPSDKLDAFKRRETYPTGGSVAQTQPTPNPSPFSLPPNETSLLPAYPPTSAALRALGSTMIVEDRADWEMAFDDLEVFPDVDDSRGEVGHAVNADVNMETDEPVSPSAAFASTPGVRQDLAHFTRLSQSSGLVQKVRQRQGAALPTTDVAPDGIEMITTKRFIRGKDANVIGIRVAWSPPGHHHHSVKQSLSMTPITGSAFTEMRGSPAHQSGSTTPISGTTSPTSPYGSVGSRNSRFAVPSTRRGSLSRSNSGSSSRSRSRSRSRLEPQTPETPDMFSSSRERLKINPESADFLAALQAASHDTNMNIILPEGLDGAIELLEPGRAVSALGINDDGGRGRARQPRSQGMGLANPCVTGTTEITNDLEAVRIASGTVAVSTKPAVASWLVAASSPRSNLLEKIPAFIAPSPLNEVAPHTHNVELLGLMSDDIDVAGLELAIKKATAPKKEISRNPKDKAKAATGHIWWNTKSGPCMSDAANNQKCVRQENFKDHPTAFIRSVPLDPGALAAYRRWESGDRAARPTEVECAFYFHFVVTAYAQEGRALLDANPTSIGVAEKSTPVDILAEDVEVSKKKKKTPSELEAEVEAAYGKWSEIFAGVVKSLTHPQSERMKQLQNNIKGRRCLADLRQQATHKAWADEYLPEHLQQPCTGSGSNGEAAQIQWQSRYERWVAGLSDAEVVRRCFLRYRDYLVKEEIMDLDDWLMSM